MTPRILALSALLLIGCDKPLPPTLAPVDPLDQLADYILNNRDLFCLYKTHDTTNHQQAVDAYFRPMCDMSVETAKEGLSAIESVKMGSREPLYGFTAYHYFLSDTLEPEHFGPFLSLSTCQKIESIGRQSNFPTVACFIISPSTCEPVFRGLPACYTPGYASPGAFAPPAT